MKSAKGPIAPYFLSIFWDHARGTWLLRLPEGRNQFLNIRLVAGDKSYMGMEDSIFIATPIVEERLKFTADWSFKRSYWDEIPAATAPIPEDVRARLVP